MARLAATPNPRGLNAVQAAAKRKGSANSLFRQVRGQTVLASAKKVLITGASSGIGRATAKRFAEGGWEVCVLARRAAELEQLLGELPEGDHLLQAGDYSSPQTAVLLAALLK